MERFRSRRLSDPFSLNSAMTRTSGDPASRLSDWYCCFVFTESSILGPDSGYCTFYFLSGILVSSGKIYHGHFLLAFYSSWQPCFSPCYITPRFDKSSLNKVSIEWPESSWLPNRPRNCFFRLLCKFSSLGFKIESGRGKIEVLMCNEGERYRCVWVDCTRGGTTGLSFVILLYLFNMIFSFIYLLISTNLMH